MPPSVSELPSAPGERSWGAALQALVLAGGLWVVAVSALAALLGGLGLWLPWLGGGLSVVLFGGSLWLAARVPAQPLPRWSAGLLLAVVVGFTIWTGATHSEQVLPRRDAATNFQAAISLADTGARGIVLQADDLGGPEVLAQPGITLASPGFYAVGTPELPRVQPQFVIGPAAVLSLGQWVGGPTGQFLVPVVATGVALLGVGLLTARTVGARWAPLGAAATGVVFPIVHIARATYSEPLALLTLTAGLLALLIAARAGDLQLTGQGGWGSPALLAGVLVGGTSLVRIDGLREAILVLPVAMALFVRGLRWPRWLCLGAAVGGGVGLAAALLLSHQYLATIAGSLVPLLALGVMLIALAWGVLSFADRGWRLPEAVSRHLPALSAGLVVIVGLVLASRPWWLVTRQDPDDPGARYVAGMQKRQGLPVDGGRTYAEHTLTWLSWWVGPVALVIALVVLAGCAYTVATAWRDGAPLPAWFGPLVVVTGSSLLTLYRPGITPDHPWADRRLVVVLPFVVVLVVAGVAAATRWVGRRAPSAAAVVVAVGLTASLVGPALGATLPHRSGRVEAGELAAVDAACGAFADGDVALMVDSRAANEWPQVLRGQCGVPALSTTGAVRQDPTALRSLVASTTTRVRAAGKRLVVVAAGSASSISDLGVIPRQLVAVTVQEDDRLLTRRPDATVPLPVELWAGTP